MKCATCNETNGCEHIQPTANIEEFQEVLIKQSERASGVPEPTQVYVPGQRDYSVAPVAGASTRGPSVVIGARGPAGTPGKDSTVPGPAGRDGKDANVDEVIDVATRAMEARLSKFQAGVGDLLTRTLRQAGVIDSNGRAILLQGPSGRDGRDSTVPGPVGATGRAGRDGVDGKDGQSIVGPQGAPGRDGDISECKEFVHKEIADLALGMKEMILQILVERNVLDADGKAIPGPEGKQGIPGIRGVPGSIDAALANCTKLVDERLAMFRDELLKK